MQRFIGLGKGAHQGVEQRIEEFRRAKSRLFDSVTDLLVVNPVFAVVARHIQPDRSYFNTSPQDSVTKLIKVRISPHPVKEVTRLGQEVDGKPRTEESRLLDPPIVSPVQEGRQ